MLESRRLLASLRSLLEEFGEELQEEEARRRQLLQTYADDKASWEVKWAEMKSRVRMETVFTVQVSGGKI